MIFKGQSKTNDVISVAPLPVVGNYPVSAGNHHPELGSGLLFGSAGGGLGRYSTVSEERDSQASQRRSGIDIKVGFFF